MNTQHASTTRHPLRQAIRHLLLPAGALGMPALALAGGPTGEVIVGGDVGVNRPDTSTTIIDQASWRAIIDWQTFNVGLNEYVVFNQPGTSAVILNRVVGGDPTSILGSMTANGQVFLVNPYGVFFGASAQLDVHGLLATTLDISNDDFMAGNYSFAKTGGAPDAGVVNQGSINADGGYVVLAADHVDNSGVIAARAGHVVMAAGSALTLDIEGDGLVNFAVDEAALSDMAGVSNAGAILADGGTVLMTAKVANDLVATAVNNEGLIQAHSISERDGVIYLAAEGGDIVNAGTLDANGAAGENGGHIRVLSDQDISLENGSVITAQGNGAGDGGTVRVIAEEVLAVNETAAVYAQGGTDGSGGFVEVSGHGDFLLAGDVRVGAGGLLLVDPTILNIATGSGNPSYGSVGVGWIEDRLDSGSDVLLVASNTIQADPLVTVLTAIGAGDLNLAIGSVTGTQSTSACLIGGHCTLPINPLNSLNFGPGGTINLAGMDISIGGDFNATALTGQVQLGNVTTTGGAINIIGGLEITTGALDAAGNITLDATGTAFTMTDFGITVNGNVDAGGSVAMLAYGNSTEPGYGGGTVDVLGNIQAANGVTIEARSFNFGDQINISGSISAGGDVQLAGSSSTSISTNGTGINVGDVNGANIFITHTRNLQTGRLTAVADVSVAGNNGAFMQITDGATGSIAISAGGNVNIGGASTLRLGDGTFGDGSAWHGQAVNAGGSIALNAARVHGGALTATNGNITVTAGSISGSGEIFLGSVTGQASPSPVFTFADVNAGGMVQLTATGDTGGAVSIQAGNINGASVDVQAINNDTSYGGDAAIRTGDVTATAGLIRLLADAGIGAISGSAAANIDAGKLTATDTVSVEAFTEAQTSLGGHIVTGAISGDGIFVHHDGNKADISLGSLIANNTTGPARVDVVTGDGNGLTQAGNITINGDILVSGVAVSSSCGTQGNCLGPFNQPSAAEVRLQAGNGSVTGLAPGNVTVTGNVDITATAANVTVIRTTENGTTTVSGTAGAANFFVYGNSATVGGSANLGGADVLVEVQANQVSFGNASLNASGHNITLNDSPAFGTGSLNSSNNAGNAIMHIRGLGSGSGETPANSVTLGAVTINGIGEAGLHIAALNTTLGSVAVNATAATYNRTLIGNYTGNVSNVAFSNNNQGGEFNLDQGAVTLGAATIRVSGGTSCVSSSCTENPAASLTATGNLAVTGVGLAQISAFATNINITGGLSATATAGTVTNGVGVGTFSSGSGGSLAIYNVSTTASGSFGDAEVKLDTDAGSGAGITVGGAITISGPQAGFTADAKGNVQLGAITIIGTGENYHETNLYTLSSGPSGALPSFTTSFQGQHDENGTIISGSTVTVNGDITIQGVGFTGALIQGNAVAVQNISITTTAMDQTTLDTRLSPTAVTMQRGDAAFGITNLDSLGAPVAGATITGNVTVDGAIDAHVGINGDISGILSVRAGTGDIDTTMPSFVSDSGSPIILPPMNASASAMAFNAGGNILLSGSTLTIGSGSAGVAADTTVATAAGIGASPINGAFSAGGTLDLGNLNLSGNYLWLQANNFGAIGTVTLPATALVQFTTFDLTRTLGLDLSTGGTAQTTLTEGYAAAFSGANYLAFGDSAHSGDLLLGETGAVNLATEQLIFATTGNVTGANTVNAAKVNFLTGALSNITANLNTGIVNITAGNDVGLNLSGPAIFTLGSDTFGNVALATTGDLTLQSGISATDIWLRSTMNGLVLGANALTATNGIILETATTFSGTGLLSANHIVLDGSTSTDFVLTTNVADVNVISANNVTVNNTGAATIEFASSIGLFTGTFGGAVNLVTAFTGTGFDLTSPGNFTYGANTVNAGSGTITLDIGGTATGTGLLTASNFVLFGETNTDYAFNTKAGWISIQSAGGITVDNAAHTGSAYVFFGSDTFTDVAFTMGGDTNIGVASSLTADNASIVVNNGSLNIANHTFNIANDLGLSADNNIFLSGSMITAGNLLMVAGSDITDSSGGQGGVKQGGQGAAALAPASITADAMTLLAGGDILLSQTTFAIGSGDMSALTGITGDSELLAQLSEEGIAPASTAPNATLIANGAVQVGAMSVAGGYLYMEARDVSFGGAISGPQNLLVQLVPFGGIGTIGLENTAGTTDTINLGSADVGLIQDGATLALGSSAYQGNVTLGLAGPVDVGARNFVVVTTGTVDSLANITSTGLVASLEELVSGPDIFDEPTLEEIDADYSSNPSDSDDEEGEEEGEDTDDDGVADTEGGDPLIEHDSSGETKVCAG